MKYFERAKELAIELCPALTEEEIVEAFNRLDGLTEDEELNINIITYYEGFENGFANMSGGEQRAVFGIWFALA